MIIDLKPLLDSWPYDPQNNIRIVELNQRRVLQVRTLLGLEQYELEGRPDGKKPYGFKSVFDYYLHKYRECIHGGQEFSLAPEECNELFQEATLYYLRYTHLFHIGRWDLTIRDTSRNLAVFNFIYRFAQMEEDKFYLEKWRPYVLKIRAAAFAMREVENGNYLKALQILRRELAKVENLPNINEEIFYIEKERAINMLTELIHQIELMRPLSLEEELEIELQKAIQHEEFEKAARLRDQLRAIRQSQPYAPDQQC